MDRFADIRKSLLEFARQDEELHAVVVVGSTARTDHPADELSDLDLIIVTDDPEKWYSGAYPDRLGEVCISYLAKTVNGDPERRVLYKGFLDVDFVALTPEQCKAAILDESAYFLLGRGYQVLYDDSGVSDLIDPNHNRKAQGTKPVPDEQSFVQMCQEYYFHTIWVVKKILRKEYWIAATCIDGWLKQPLLDVITLQAEQEGKDTWHGGRFLDRWAAPAVTDMLRDCFGRYTQEDLIHALVSSTRLYTYVCRDICARNGYTFPETAEQTAMEFLQEKFGQLFDKEE